MLIRRFQMALPAFLLLAAAATAADDIKPDAILDKYVEVTGGRAAYDKIKSEIANGTIEITSIGLSGTLTNYRAAPDKSYTLIDFAGVGKAEEGSDGKVTWSINGMEGARIKEGDERTVALRNDAFHVETRWRDFFKKTELAGTEDVGGKPCYKLVLTPNEGSAETRYYEKATNLLVKVVVPITTPQGAVTAELGLGDYKDEGGILVAHTITQKVPNADILIKITSVKYNPELPADRFDLPAEIKALQGKSDKSEKK